jgi:Na+/melibiose symporter-like transporter
MASPVPPERNTGNVPAPPQGRNSLALTSFVLSLAPLAVMVLDAVLTFVILSLPSAVNTFLSCGGFIASIGAIVTAGLALGRAKWYPPQQAGTGYAIAGLILGILDIVLVIVIFAFLAVSSACSRPPYC